MVKDIIERKIFNSFQILGSLLLKSYVQDQIKFSALLKSETKRGAFEKSVFGSL